MTDEEFLKANMSVLESCSQEQWERCLRITLAASALTSVRLGTQSNVSELRDVLYPMAIALAVAIARCSKVVAE